MKEIRTRKKEYKERFFKPKEEDTKLGFYIFLVLLFIVSYLYFSYSYFS